MRDERTHPLLAQVPLTVSPFVSLPTAVTLPYTYKSMPSTLPPPITGVTGAHSSSSSSSSTSSSSTTTITPTAGGHDAKPKYVVTPTAGYAAHPDEIVASCRAVRAQLARRRGDMEAGLRRFEDGIRDRDLAEKRRVAPGWLDSDARLLEPERRFPPAAAGGPVVEADAHGSEVAGHYESVAGRLAEMRITATATAAAAAAATTTTMDRERGGEGPSEMAVDQGAELDRAFGGLR